MPIEVVNPKGSEPLLERFHFSQGAWSGDVLHCSGQIGMGPDGSVPDDPEEEFRNAWRGVVTVLEQAGLGTDAIVEYTTYHVGLREHMGTFMKVRDEFLGEPWPAWTAIGITELAVAGARVEVRVTARRP